MTRQLPALGVFLMVAATSSLAIKDGFAKLLVADLHPIYLVWLQYVVIWLVLAPFIIQRYGAGALIPRPFGLQFLRGLAATATVLFFFYAVGYIQLAEAHAMVFVGPLLATLLSAALLGEQVGRHRIVAALLGFTGVILILRPDFSAASLGHFLALGAGASVAVYFLANRRAASHGAPLASVAHSVVVGAVLLAPAIFFITPGAVSGHGWLLPAFFLFSIAGQCFLVMSFTFAPASLVAPFHYSQIITSILFGYAVFDQLPDALAITGIVIVIACGVYVAWREARARGRAKTVAM